MNDDTNIHAFQDNDDPDPTSEFIVLFCLSGLLDDAIDLPLTTVGDSMDKLGLPRSPETVNTISDAFQSLQNVIHDRMNDLLKEEGHV